MSLVFFFDTLNVVVNTLLDEPRKIFAAALTCWLSLQRGNVFDEIFIAFDKIRSHLLFWLTFFFSLLHDGAKTHIAPIQHAYIVIKLILFSIAYRMNDV